MADAGKVIPIYKGDWVIHSSYEVLDQTTHQGSTYTAKNNVLDSAIAPDLDTTNWFCSSKGFVGSTLNDITADDTSGLLGSAGDTVSSQALADKISDMIKNDLLPKTSVVSEDINDESKAASTALTHLINQRITNLTNSIKERHIIIVTDSYGTVPEQKFPDLVSQYINDSHYHIYNCSRGGTGFGNSSAEYTFLQQLKDWESVISDKTIITDIIVIGNGNDVPLAQSAIGTGIANFASYCKSNYPNAIVNIGVASAPIRNGETQLHALKQMIKYYSYCPGSGSGFLENLEYSMYDTAYMSSDNIHPNNFGAQFIAKNIAGYILCKNINIYLHLDKGEVGFTPDGNFTVDGSSGLNVSMDRVNNTGWICNDTNAIYNCVIQKDFDGSGIKLGTFNRAINFGDEGGNYCVFVPLAFVYWNGSELLTETVPCRIYMINADLYIAPIYATGTQSSGYDHYEIRQVTIPPFMMHFN